jgi:hypothetical protein
MTVLIGVGEGEFFFFFERFAARRDLDIVKSGSWCGCVGKRCDLEIFRWFRKYGIFVTYFQ